MCVNSLTRDVYRKARLLQGRINKCGGPVQKNVWGPPSPPPMPSSGDYVFNFIIKYRIDKDLDNKLDF